MKKAEPSRFAALKTLQGIFERGWSFDQAIKLPSSRLSPEQLSYCRALVYGVLRTRLVLQDRSNQYLQKPLRDKDADIGLILQLGLYQLGWTNTAQHAAIQESVELSRAVKKNWAAGLINAVLRNYQRDGCPTQAPESIAESRQSSHPKWLYERLRQAWPDHHQSIIRANQTQAPMWLRVSTHRVTKRDFLAALDEAGIGYRTDDYCVDGVVLQEARAVDQIPGFDQGWFAVQDGAAQLAADLLAPEPGDRVLDACAAPGGKTCHLLQRCQDIDLVAVDHDSDRASRIDQNLRRLKLRAEVAVGDASEPDQWWDGQQFDKILLDAPCSATGVIRRHPDIKWLRRDRDIAQLSRLQANILASSWDLLKPGGRLLYATCSVLPDENWQVIQAFTEQQPQVVIEPIAHQWGQTVPIGRQLLPGQHEMDGFYYAVLQKSDH